jgi:glycosyltransferase 2 family protein
MIRLPGKEHMTHPFNYRRTTGLLRWMVSIGLLLILFYTIELDSIRATLKDTRIVPVGIAFIMLLFDRYLGAVRWGLILRPYAKVRFSILTRITFISTFLANFLPSALSSDVIRSYFLHKEKADVAAVVSSVLLDRIVGFVSLLLLSACALAVAYAQGYWDSDWIILVATMMGITATALLLIGSSWLGAVVTRLCDCSWRIGRQVGRTLVAVREYPWTARRAAKILGFAGGAYVLGTVATYLVFYAIGGRLPFGYFFIFTFVVQLAMSIPVTIGSLGVHEGAWVVVLGSVGVAPGQALLFALVLRTVSLCVSLPGGVLYALYRPHLPEVTPAVSEEKSASVKV